jgi:hypothetical protein
VVIKWNAHGSCLSLALELSLQCFLLNTNTRLDRLSALLLNFSSSLSTNSIMDPLAQQYFEAAMKHYAANTGSCFGPPFYQGPPQHHPFGMIHQGFTGVPMPQPGYGIYPSSVGTQPGMHRGAAVPTNRHPAFLQDPSKPVMSSMAQNATNNPLPTHSALGGAPGQKPGDAAGQGQTVQKPPVNMSPDIKYLYRAYVDACNESLKVHREWQKDQLQVKLYHVVSLMQHGLDLVLLTKRFRYDEWVAEMKFSKEQLKDTQFLKKGESTFGGTVSMNTNSHVL